MATYSVEIRKRTSTTYGDVYYPKTLWANILNIPASFNPASHTHGNVTNDGKIGATADLPVFTGSAGALGTKTAADARTALELGSIATSSKYYRSIKNFTSVSFNGTTEISCALTEDPRGKKIGIVFGYVYMGSRQRQIVWLEVVDTTTQDTVFLTGGISLSSTVVQHVAFNAYFKSSNNTLFIKNTYTQLQYQATASADTIAAIASTYAYVYDVITID
jgi:hypothetical protein